MKENIVHVHDCENFTISTSPKHSAYEICEDPINQATVKVKSNSSYHLY